MGVPAKFRQNRPTFLVDSYYRPLHSFLRNKLVVIHVYLENFISSAFSCFNK